MAETKAPEKKTDWVTPLAIIGGGGALAVGVFFMLKGKKTITPGQKLKVTFNFDYRRDAGNYLLRVALGNIVGWVFSTEESSIQDYPISLPASLDWEKFSEKVDYSVPSALSPNVHDAEFSIRYTNGKIVPGQRVFADNILSM